MLCTNNNNNTTSNNNSDDNSHGNFLALHLLFLYFSICVSFFFFFRLVFYFRFLEMLRPFKFELNARHTHNKFHTHTYIYIHIHTHLNTRTTRFTLLCQCCSGCWLLYLHLCQCPHLGVYTYTLNAGCVGVYRRVLPTSAVAAQLTATSCLLLFAYVCVQLCTKKKN